MESVVHCLSVEAAIAHLRRKSANWGPSGDGRGITAALGSVHSLVGEREGGVSAVGAVAHEP